MRLLLDEGKAVGALVDLRVALVRTDADTVERAIVLAGAVVAAGSNAAFDALVRLAMIKVHDFDLLAGWLFVIAEALCSRSRRLAAVLGCPRTQKICCRSRAANRTGCAKIGFSWKR